MTTDQQQAVATWLTERGIPAPPVEDAEVSRPEPESGDAEGSTPTAEDPEADPYAVARTIALRKLTVQARTRHELEQALRAKQVPEQVARDVLDRLTERRAGQRCGVRPRLGGVSSAAPAPVSIGPEARARGQGCGAGGHRRGVGDRRRGCRVRLGAGLGPAQAGAAGGSRSGGALPAAGRTAQPPGFRLRGRRAACWPRCSARTDREQTRPTGRWLRPRSAPCLTGIRPGHTLQERRISNACSI